MTRRRRVPFLSLLAVMAASLTQAHAQKLYLGCKADISCDISDRWIAEARIATGDAHTPEPYNALFAGVGGGFRLSREATLAAHCSIAYAIYDDITNKDLILKLHESISWKRPSGFFFGFFLEQRRLIFRPSGCKLNASCLGGTLGMQRAWQKPGISANASLTVIANAKSENSAASFIQRVKISTSVRKRIGTRIALGADYSHAFGGRRQIYIADRDGMGCLTACIDFFFDRPAN
ncbi:MAG: hypothetical protein II375_06345 [Bacteroidales bacterium]|nr:hypothetical protein [Bacteroidales bacterium]